MSAINLVQVTDTHLFAQPKSKLHKMNTLDSLNEVLDCIKRNENQIDCIVATGDIAQDASFDAYKYFMLSIEKFVTPFRWIPGNHDNSSLMLKASSGTDYNEKKLRVGNWEIIFLDTSVKHKVAGRLSKIELEFLERALIQVEHDSVIQNVLLCLHHNPISVQQAWCETIGLRNHLEFFKIIEKYQSVRCAIFGHLHQELDFIHEGIRLLCAPSTCVQFLANAIRLELDSSEPGYRRLRLHEDGSIDTEVIRVKGHYEHDY